MGEARPHRRAGRRSPPKGAAKPARHRREKKNAPRSRKQRGSAGPKCFFPEEHEHEASVRFLLVDAPLLFGRGLSIRPGLVHRGGKKNSSPGGARARFQISPCHGAGIVQGGDGKGEPRPTCTKPASDFVLPTRPFVLVADFVSALASCIVGRKKKGCSPIMHEPSFRFRLATALFSCNEGAE